MSKYEGEIGNAYNNLTCEKYLGHKNKRPNYLWRCVCGGTKECILPSVKRGHTKKCTQCRSQVSPAKHGKTMTPIYNTWRCMRRRCDEPTNNRYAWYGAKGITYDERWKDFEEFYLDMSASHFYGATLDRIDNAGNYCKENCQWLTRADNSTKKRKI